MDYIRSSLEEARQALETLLGNQETLKRIRKAADLLIETFQKGGRLFSCGNGGSMCDAMHFAEELTGRFRKNRRGYPALAISDPSHLTCVANDFGYDQVFSRYLESQGREGDCLIALTTSGKSPNIIQAAKTGRALGIKVVGLTGKTGSVMEEWSDVCICTPGGQFADRVQELHIKVLHILIEMVERHFHPENYA
jgi:D-sedoheptulose 7-phosphate isomerase